MKSVTCKWIGVALLVITCLVGRFSNAQPAATTSTLTSSTNAIRLKVGTGSSLRADAKTVLEDDVTILATSFDGFVLVEPDFLRHLSTRPSTVATIGGEVTTRVATLTSTKSGLGGTIAARNWARNAFGAKTDSQISWYFRRMDLKRSADVPGQPHCYEATVDMVFSGVIKKNANKTVIMQLKILPAGEKTVRAYGQGIIKLSDLEISQYLPGIWEPSHAGNLEDEIVVSVDWTLFSTQ